MAFLKCDLALICIHLASITTNDFFFNDSFEWRGYPKFKFSTSQMGGGGEHWMSTFPPKKEIIFG